MQILLNLSQQQVSEDLPVDDLDHDSLRGVE